MIMYTQLSDCDVMAVRLAKMPSHELQYKTSDGFIVDNFMMSLKNGIQFKNNPFSSGLNMN